ncbi:hypothetical protein CG471_14740 [Sphingobium sp. IP1]|uniref:Uncharacterized protein n=1 Tax=Sphingobium yanoikuyae TaxID=13690 RepID=A0A3G2UR23_SPHYA|nr:hypothetical protein EBF16_10585 [Sphingobium yanoikuyae]PHP18965.1 hypothetical protein CG471_14740 [Sphingobium sp. IP1]
MTLRHGTDEETPLPQSRAGKIVGIADDEKGVQVLIVEIDGHADRGHGSHCPWLKGGMPKRAMMCWRAAGWP